MSAVSQQEGTNKADHVAVSLLAFAKDGRYTNELAVMLSNVINPHVQISSNAENDLGQEDTLEVRSALQPEIDLLSRIIYAWFIVNEGRSIGLEHLGISYHQSVGSRKRLYLFAALNTVFPYLMQRAGKAEGWKDLCRVRIHSILRSSPRFDAEREVRRREQLRGVDRRRVYEEMRSRMIEHSNLNLNANRQTMRELDAQLFCNRETSSTNLSHHFGKKIQYILASMAAAAGKSMPLAHELPGSGSNGLGGTRHYGNNRMANLFNWAMRINLALFYVNGEYFSILHRLTRLKIEKIHDSTISIVAERPEYKMIGLMIFLQAGAKGIQAATELVLDSFFSHALDTSNENKAELEVKVPSDSTSLHKATTVRCGICMAERRHPAAPARCGHIFCWSCIQQWIATVRHECPLCRSPTRPQDVIALYNYSPK